jgi:hypothetical protein
MDKKQTNTKHKTSNTKDTSKIDKSKDWKNDHNYTKMFKNLTNVCRVLAIAESVIANPASVESSARSRRRRILAKSFSLAFNFTNFSQLIFYI